MCSSDLIIDQIEATLRGSRLLPTEAGLQRYMSELRAGMHKYIPMGNYDAEAINDKLRDLEVDINALLFINYDAWQLDNFADWTSLIRIASNAIEAAYNRSVGNGERRFLGKTSEVKESVVPKPPTRGFTFFRPPGAPQKKTEEM